MKKPKAKIRRIFKYTEMYRYIEYKYKCNLRDYAAHLNGVTSTVSYNVDHNEAWCEKYYPLYSKFKQNPINGQCFNQEGLDFYNSKEGKVWFNDMNVAYRRHPEGAIKELPHLDFWHFLIDNYSISNGTIMTIHFDELKDCCQEDWQKEICELFDKEFGTVEIDFSW